MIIQRTAEDLQRIRKSNALKPQRDALLERFPQYYKEGVNKQTGRKEWGFSNIPLRDKDGRRTKEGKDLQEMMTPYARAESGRARTIKGPPTEALKDANGSTYYSANPKDVADMNGWHSAGRINGLLATVVSGDFCPRCDLRKSWCECWQTANYGG